ncbi:unnamed protein product, partial [Leptidea sinapis]
LGKKIYYIKILILINSFINLEDIQIIKKRSHRYRWEGIGKSG